MRRIAIGLAILLSAFVVGCAPRAQQKTPLPEYQLPTPIVQSIPDSGIDHVWDDGEEMAIVRFDSPVEEMSDELIAQIFYKKSIWKRENPHKRIMCLSLNTVGMDTYGAFGQYGFTRVDGFTLTYEVER